MKFLIPKKTSIFGYSLIELLVVTSIMGILFTIGMASYNKFNRAQVLQQAYLELKNNLRLAQSKAMSGEKPAGCGSLYGYQVEFLTATANDSYNIKPICDTGASPLPPPLLGRTYLLPVSVRFDSTVTPYPPGPVFFKVMAQGVADAREIKIIGYNIAKTINVTATGEIK